MGARSNATARLILAVVVLSAGTVFLSPAAGAQGNTQDEAEAAQELADRHVPVMMLKAQEYPCDPDGEMYAPTAVDVVLDNPQIMLREVSIGDPLVKLGPTASDLFDLGEGYYLDFPGLAVDPGCLYEQDFDKFSDGRPPAVYAHIARQPDQPGFLALQYYFYWYFNDFNNKHESDWEGIQLLFEAATVEDALASEPIEVAFAQHDGGETAAWDAAKLDRDGSRPVVYSSKGSHASYFGSALYLGRRGNQGFGCDNTDGPSERVDPEAIVIPDTVVDPDDPLAWVMFEGRWGERRPGSFNGPTGPLDKERWTDPIDWQNGLRSSSVVIPGGDTQGDQTITVFCNAVQWGSGTVITFTQSPGRVVVTAAILLVVGVWVLRRTDWSEVAPMPIRRRRRAGQLIRAAATSARNSPRAVVSFGAIYVPIVVLVAMLGALISVIPLLKEIQGLAGPRSGTRLVLALLVGTVPHLFGYTAVNAVVATYAEAIDSGQARSSSDCAWLVWQRRRDLVSGLVRAMVIVIVLIVSVIGIPWGIRQLVRYQFMAQAVMLEDLDGRRSLARSSELVRGRWWHTALVIGSFNGLFVIIGLVFSLLLLLLLPSMPLWLFSAAVALINGLVVPFVALAQTLLYGDAVAEDEASPDRDLVNA